MNILLDFDGVLFDSSWEVTVIIILTYLNAFPDSNISKSLSKSNTSKVLSSLNSYLASHAFKIIQNENNKLNNYLRKFRTYCIDVDDFFVISSLINDNLFSIKNINYKTVNHNFYYSYKDNILNSKKDELDRFVKFFYESRRYIKESNLEFWLMLSEPFEQEVKIFLDMYKKYKNVGILSTKQKYAILEILHYHKITINPDVVFAKENQFVHKGKKIKEIIQIWNIDPKHLHFVDDLLENLLRIKEYVNDVNLYMSMWGYNNYYHRRLAKKNGILLINSLRQLLNLKN